jgi:hypothetical protein
MTRPPRHSAAKAQAVRTTRPARRPRHPKMPFPRASEMDQFVEMLRDNDDVPVSSRAKEPNAIFWDFWN